MLPVMANIHEESGTIQRNSGNAPLEESAEEDEDAADKDDCFEGECTLDDGMYLPAETCYSVNFVATMHSWRSSRPRVQQLLACVREPFAHVLKNCSSPFATARPLQQTR